MKYIYRLRYLVARGWHMLASLLCLIVLLVGMTACGTTPLGLAQSAIPLRRPPKPFMHYPYYGQEAFHKRITSYFDHDKPWYASDGIFVRYDGRRWTGSGDSILNCQGGVNCYDGHNGYDLNLWFEPVLSSAAGKVVRAGWYNPLNHNAAFGLWAAIDHGNGFVTVYGHLSDLIVSQNEHVGVQWQIGTSGTTGSATGPHLHFGTYYYPSWRATDPSGWRGHSADPNIVPDYRLWTSGTNDTSVPLLSGRGKKTSPGAILVDDGGPGWSSTGHWHRSKTASDIGGKLHWTETSSRTVTATATWSARLPTSGYYEVGAFVDDNHASGSWVAYNIYSADSAHHHRLVRHRAELDESHIGIFQSPYGKVNTRAQWIGLGTYYFTSDQPGRVVLSNDTGENGLQIAADGIEFVPLQPPASETPSLLPAVILQHLVAKLFFSVESVR